MVFGGDVSDFFSGELHILNTQGRQIILSNRYKLEWLYTTPLTTCFKLW